MEKEIGWRLWKKSSETFRRCLNFVDEKFFFMSFCSHSVNAILPTTGHDQITTEIPWFVFLHEDILKVVLMKDINQRKIMMMLFSFEVVCLFFCQISLHDKNWLPFIQSVIIWKRTESICCDEFHFFQFLCNDRIFFPEHVCPRHPLFFLEMIEWFSFVKWKKKKRKKIKNF